MVFVFSARDLAERLYAWALLPCSDNGQQAWVLERCPLVKAAQNN